MNEKEISRMRILICDDDDLMAEQLHKCILEYFERNALKIPDILHFSNGEALLADTGKKIFSFLILRCLD